MAEKFLDLAWRKCY